MAQKQNKTTETTADVTGFIHAVADEKKRADSLLLADIMKKVTGFEPKMWGPSIIGFGSYHYKYESGREGDAPLVAFSPRKDAISLYMAQDLEKREALLKKFGRHKAAKGCIYIKTLEDIDVKVLEEMIRGSVKYLKDTYTK